MFIGWFLLWWKVRLEHVYVWQGFDTKNPGVHPSED